MYNYYTISHVENEYKNESLVDFNRMSINQGLSYTKRLGNHVHCKFLFTLFVLLFLKIFPPRSNRIQIILKKNYLTQKWEPSWYYPTCQKGLELIAIKGYSALHQSEYLFYLRYPPLE